MSIVVLIGPSGAGKSTVAHILQTQYGFHLQRTVTTRPQRDVHDTDHIFVNEETYESMEKSHAFLGELPVFNYKYGLPKFDTSARTLLLLRAPAIKEFLTQFHDAVIVQLEAPYDVLESRLTARRSSDRIDSAALAQEITLGRTLTTHCFDSSKLSPEEIAAHIEAIIPDAIS